MCKEISQDERWSAEIMVAQVDLRVRQPVL